MEAGVKYVKGNSLYGDTYTPQREGRSTISPQYSLASYHNKWIALLCNFGRSVLPLATLFRPWSEHKLVNHAHQIVNDKCNRNQERYLY